MCPKGEPSIMEASDADSDSDSYRSSAESSSDYDDEEMAAGPSTEPDETLPEEEEEEDEVIKAIRAENTKQRDHPPPIQCDETVTDLCFHPLQQLLAVSNVVGDVTVYKYSNEENAVLRTLELHTKSCRDVEFSQDGKAMFSAGKDLQVMLSDVETGDLVRFYDQAHDSAINCLYVIDENCFATGDDDGTVKLWDLRRNAPEPIYKTKKNEDFISDMITNEPKKYLLISSGDGSLTTLDLHNRKVFMQSEEYDEELTCLGLFRSETKLLAGSSRGKLFLYNWNEFGLHSDTFPGNKAAINDMIPITENIVVTACEDGVLRATHLFPHRHLGVVGQHSLSVEKVDICTDGDFIASSSYDNDIKFWNIKYFEDFEKVSQKHNKHQKKKEMATNLPSSQVKNASDFFSGLC